MNSFLLAVLGLCGLGAASAVSGQLNSRSTGYNITGIYEPHLSHGAKIYYTTDANYSTEVVPRVSTFDPPDVFVTILPATVKDIQTIIKLSNQHKIPFWVTGGGHGVEPGFANVKNSINIQLTQLNTTSLSADASTVTIGPGADFVSVYGPLYGAKKQIAVGNSPCVNMIGATVGAGVGPMQGQFGLVLDALLSVDLVTAKGDLVTASFHQNQDLFWAVRGAGANFGVVVSATYKTYDWVNNGQVIVADFILPTAANVSVFELLQSWDSDDVFPSEMGLSIVGGYNRTSNTPSITFSMTYLGTQEQAQPYINKILAMNPSTWRNVSVGWNLLTYDQVFGQGEAACVRGVYVNHYNIGTQQTNVQTYTEAYNEHMAYVAANTWFSGQLIFQRYGAKTMSSVPKSKRGVYPWRDIKTLVNLVNVYDGPDHDEDVFAFSKQQRDLFQSTSGFPTLQSYINYGFGDEGPDVWYGKENVPRLSALKRKWDPLNQFGFGNPIPL